MRIGSSDAVNSDPIASTDLCRHTRIRSCGPCASIRNEQPIGFGTLAPLAVVVAGELHSRCF